MCLHEFVWLVAKESTRFDVGHFMWNFHSLMNCVWHCKLILRLAGVFGFLQMILSVEKVCTPVIYEIEVVVAVYCCLV